MTAARLVAPNELVIAQLAVPSPGPGEVVIRVRAATICGTDVRILRGRKTKGVRFPSTIGHEFSGEVVELGEGVDGFEIGDRVAADPVIPCHRCAYCLSGRENVCANRTAIGYEFDGAFAEYLLIPRAAVQGGQLYKLPAELAWEEAALAEPLACCLNGQQNAQVRLGDAVVILGAGPIGLMHSQLASSAGAREVIVSEPHPHRRSLAEQMGADSVVDPSQEDLAELVRERTDGLGADVVIVAVGLPQLVGQALSLARKGGRVNLFAGFSVGDFPPLDVNLIHYNELQVSGASALTRHQYASALSLIISRRVAVADLVTHRYPLQQALEAMSVAERGEGVKVAIQP
jgi:L-iditol 2-dehydrogenase